MRSARGASSVDLVGYSAGGVIVRLWATEYDGGSVARRVVTLGSPHHGTDLAALAADLAPTVVPDRVPAARPGQRPDPAAQPRRRDARGPGVGVDLDDRRPDLDAARDRGLDGALDFSVQEVCPGADVAHGQLPRDPVVIAMVEAQLGRDAPGPAGPDACAASAASR